VPFNTFWQGRKSSFTHVPLLQAADLQKPWEQKKKNVFKANTHGMVAF